MGLDDYRIEGLPSCLHGISIYEPCSCCGRTEEEIYKELKEPEVYKQFLEDIEEWDE